jgi:hypothetical protein
MLINVELGNRVPDTVQDQFRAILDSNVMIPSLSHYVRYGYHFLKALFLVLLLMELLVFSKPGEQEIIRRLSTIYIASLIILCKIGIDLSINMRSSISLCWKQTLVATKKL